MNYIMFIVLGFATFCVGIFGFAQIVGSVRSRQKNFLIPIVVWCVLLLSVYYLVNQLLPNYMNALYLGYVISFIIILFQSKLE